MVYNDRKLTFRNFNIADWFSFYRIAAVPVLLWVLIEDWRMIFSSLLLISYLTDSVDGFLARRLKITSARGSQLDSIGDQVTFTVAMIGLFTFELEFILSQYIWILAAISLYGVQMLLAWRKYGKATAFHTYLAKVSAVVQAIFVMWALFLGPVTWLFFVMIGLGIIETLEEIILIVIYDNWKADVKGLFWRLPDIKRNPPKSAVDKDTYPGNVSKGV